MTESYTPYTPMMVATDSIIEIQNFTCSIVDATTVTCTWDPIVSDVCDNLFLDMKDTEYSDDMQDHTRTTLSCDTVTYTEDALEDSSVIFFKLAAYTDTAGTKYLHPSTNYFNYFADDNGDDEEEEDDEAAGEIQTIMLVGLVVGAGVAIAAVIFNALKKD